MTELLNRLSRFLLKELIREYPDVDYLDDTDMTQSIEDIYAKYGRKFVIIIDEWDCVFREYKEKHEA